ncbi:ABC transporter substrate-binding protein [Paenibacillus tarimensis]
MSLKKMFGRVVTISLLAVTLMTGCSLGGGKNEGAGQENNATVKIMHYDERSFYQQYGMLYSALHPEVEIDVVSTQSVRAENPEDYKEALEKFIKEQQPDVLMLSSDQYEKMAAAGELYELGTSLEQDGYDLEGIVPGLVEYLTEIGGGKLYGLTPNYHSQAIYYNKDLFDRYNISHPTDQMSWEDVLQLAMRFPTDGADEDRVYGFNMGYQGANLYQLGIQIGLTSGLSFVNPNTKQMTIHTDAWVNMFETALQALNSGALYERSENGGFSGSHEEYLLQEPFIGGKTAMVIEGPYLLNQLKEAKEVLKDKGIQNWDLVTMPVNPQNPEYNSSTSIGQIFAISAQSANTQTALDFIKYIHSEEYARVQSKSYNMGGLSIRTKYVKDEEGHHLEAFYKLKPKQSEIYSLYEKLPENFYMQYHGLAEQEMNAAQNGEISIEDALKNLQTKGQELLLQADQEAVQQEVPATEISVDEAAGEMKESDVQESTEQAGD